MGQQLFVCQLRDSNQQPTGLWHPHNLHQPYSASYWQPVGISYKTNDSVGNSCLVFLFLIGQEPCPEEPSGIPGTGQGAPAAPRSGRL